MGLVPVSKFCYPDSDPNPVPTRLRNLVLVPDPIIQIPGLGPLGLGLSLERGTRCFCSALIYPTQLLPPLLPVSFLGIFSLSTLSLSELLQAMADENRVDDECWICRDRLTLPIGGSELQMLASIDSTAIASNSGLCNLRITCLLTRNVTG